MTTVKTLNRSADRGEDRRTAEISVCNTESSCKTKARSL